MLFPKALRFMCFFVRRLVGVEIMSIQYYIFVAHLIMKLALYFLGMQMQAIMNDECRCEV